MKKLFTLFFVAACVPAFSQYVDVIEGSLKPLKGETSIDVKFTYDGMVVGKDLDEKVYIEKKKKEYNEKEPGRGDNWEKAWYNDRKEKFEPRFFELFGKYSKMTLNNGRPKYTLIFHTTRTEPGFNAGGMIRSNAKIDAEVTVVETANPQNVIAKLAVKDMPGRGAGGFDFDSGYRIQEAYAKAGKEVGKLIADQ